MIIRAASAEDAVAICAIANPLIRDTVITFTTILRTEDGTREAITQAEGAFLVAEEAGQVIGFASYGPFRAGPGYAHTKEHTIQLGPQARGRGIGRALMTRLEDHARAKGVHVLVGGVSASNHAGIAFHKNLSFVETGRMPQVGRKFDQLLDLVLMQKIL
ncbi:GNAT family N-acetyltransferase [Aestuariivita boseongensis]|uniref:GNAT family N-acetyltransferase n=1 Tax=Aestuariivita boseongensis TaxID=1470562 RepID=UPI0006809DAD|nr:GNAT family N-acetyltransferase [Aestuariivita boseongensis]